MAAKKAAKKEKVKKAKKEAERNPTISVNIRNHYGIIKSTRMFLGYAQRSSYIRE